MNIAKTLIATVAVSIALSSAAANVKINFIDPDNFSDVSRSSMNTSKSRANVVKDLEKAFTKIAKNELSDSLLMKINIKDVDLAGEFEPWRMRLSDMRILKATYPAKLELEYEVFDLDGNIVATGSDKLVDMAQVIPLKVIDDRSPYVKELFSAWISGLDLPE